jgi:hypothetical protein
MIFLSFGAVVDSNVSEKHIISIFMAGKTKFRNQRKKGAKCPYISSYSSSLIGSIPQP